MGKKSQASLDACEQFDKYLLVSVIIDNYNYGHFLAQAIDSVLAQTYTNIELIVVDDGSTDNSREVIESYGDRLTPIFQKNQGQGAAFNTGIKQAKGELVCFLDSDDYFHPEKVAKVVAVFAQHPEWVQVSHYWAGIDAESKEIDIPQKTLSRGDVKKSLLKYGKYKSALTSALAYRRHVLEQVMPIPLGHTYCADAYLMATVPFYGEVGTIDESLMFYRLHNNNAHNRQSELTHHLEGRKAIASFVNKTAAKVGRVERLNLNNDADYRLFFALQQDSVSLKEIGTILSLIGQESVAIQRNFAETIVRLSWVSICLLFPQERTSVLELGLKKYLRHKLLRQKNISTVN